MIPKTTMKEIQYLFMITMLMLSSSGFSQRRAFSNVDHIQFLPINEKESKIYHYFKNDALVEDVRFIRINVKALKDSDIGIDYNGIVTNARKESEEIHGNAKDYSWFGSLPDDTGVFFTVINDQVASKFYMGNDPCLIVPYRDDIHLLITYKPQIDRGKCGLQPSVKKMKTKIMDNQFSELTLADDNCTMRVLWVVTSEAEAKIPMSLELAARMLQDETNLAYQQSQINTRLEIARVLRTSFNENLGLYTVMAYGEEFEVPIDLAHLVNPSGPLSAVHTARNLYNADVVAMVKDDDKMGTYYGAAYGVAEDPYALHPSCAFMVHSTKYMIGGRFTFAHEIGHIQGARHNDHDGSPSYARGHVFSSASTNNRTIMAQGQDGQSADRVQFFSNPNVFYGGNAVGTSERNNARRINETANQVNNFRVTSENLLLPNETFDNEILARHLANQTISTNNQAIIATQGSRVSMRAGTSVTLLPGFHAQRGSEFTAYINTCSILPAARISSGILSNESQRKSIERVQFEYEVYPNPTSGIFIVTHPPNSGYIKVYDGFGNLALHIGSGKDSSTIDLSTFRPGIYIIHVNGEVIRVLKK